MHYKLVEKIIDHTCIPLHAKWSFQKCFEFELYCLNSCLRASDIFIEVDSNIESFKHSRLELKTLRYNGILFHKLEVCMTIYTFINFVNEVCSVLGNSNAQNLGM
jgi:hypothetical protein